MALLCFSAPAMAEQPQKWEVINPMGVAKQASIKPAPRLTSFDGKTVVMHWNGKHNGDVFMDRIAERFAKDHPKAKVVKSWEKDSSIVKISGNKAESKRVADSLKNMGADMVVAAQCD